MRPVATCQFTIYRSPIAGMQPVESDTRHAFPRHTHEQFGIGVIRRGAQRSLSGRGVVEAGAGDTITVNPGEVHDGAPIGDGGRSWRIVYFEPALVAAAALDIGEGKAGDYEIHRPVISDAVLARRLLALFAVVTRPEQTASSLRAEQLFLTLLHRVLHRRVDERPSVPSHIAAAKDLIDSDPTQAVTLADLARASGLSRFQVLRGFARSTGFTPHAYLMQRRIAIARGLIARGMRLSEAAIASGFADQSHMTRRFVRTYGVTPRAFADAVA
jgi:AraC-like DNA-binding protein